MDIKGNSNAQKAANQAPPKLEQVTQGVKKKNPVGNVARKIFSDGASSVGQHVIEDVVIPKLKDMGASAMRYMGDFIFLGRSNGDKMQNGNTPYGRFYNLNNMSYGSKKQQQQPEPNKADAVGVFDVGIPDRGTAELVIARLQERISNYGCASAADFYDLLGIDHSFVARDWGWFDLSNVSDPTYRNGLWYIPFPKIISLK